ncbi:hypothetical protein [Novosphingobium rosa]|uniref:hypothetical protein n=1 Tax=Novosphingobium rosa TaxID=76978 RepID=UPI0012EE324D|nr:hypothetical protein [Novosphingobium rosa]
MASVLLRDRGRTRSSRRTTIRQGAAYGFAPAETGAPRWLQKIFKSASGLHMWIEHGVMRGITHHQLSSHFQALEARILFPCAFLLSWKKLHFNAFLFTFRYEWFRLMAMRNMRPG